MIMEEIKFDMQKIKAFIIVDEDNNLVYINAKVKEIKAIDDKPENGYLYTFQTND